MLIAPVIFRLCRLFEMREFVDSLLADNAVKRRKNPDNLWRRSSIDTSMMCIKRLTRVNDSVFSQFYTPKFCAFGAGIAREA